MKRTITILFLFFAYFVSAQNRANKKHPIVKDSIVEITYTDGTKRRMVWINDSTVMLVISNSIGITSKTYIDPEFAETETEKYFIIKRED